MEPLLLKAAFSFRTKEMVVKSYICMSSYGLLMGGFICFVSGYIPGMRKNLNMWNVLAAVTAAAGLIDLYLRIRKKRTREFFAVKLDFYGEMLTQKQHDFLIYYYDEDLSLSEIAENEGITRQGVRDAIKRAENQLFDMENRLGLAKRFNEVKQCLAEIKECAEEISDYNLNHTLSKEISSNAAKIKALADMLGE